MLPGKQLHWPLQLQILLTDDTLLLDNCGTHDGHVPDAAVGAHAPDVEQGRQRVFIEQSIESKGN